MDCLAPERDAWKAHLHQFYTAPEADALFAAWAKEDTYVPLDVEIGLLRRCGFAVEVVWRNGTFAVLAAASYAVELGAAAFGVKRVGASRRAMAGAAAGTLLGVFFGLPGVIIGPFAGAVIGELSARSDLAQAGRVGVAAWIGFLVGTVVKVGIAFIMLGIFLFALFVP